MKDRLIGLITNIMQKADNTLKVEHFADQLLAEGVIVPPCKEGDMLYQPFPLDCKILEYKVLSWCVRDWGFHITTHSLQTGGLHPIRGDRIGKNYFLTRKEAEAALWGSEGADDE